MSFWRSVWKMWIQAPWWPTLSCVKSCVDHLWPRLVHVTKNHKAFVACNNPCFARAAGIIWGFAGQLCWIWRAEAHRTSWGPGSGLTSAPSYRHYWQQGTSHTTLGMWGTTLYTHLRSGHSTKLTGQREWTQRQAKQKTISVMKHAFPQDLFSEGCIFLDALQNWWAGFLWTARNMPSNLRTL